MFWLKFSKKIRELFTPCTAKLKVAVAEHNRICAEASCRVEKKSQQFMTALGVSNIAGARTAFPEFAKHIDDKEMRRVRNPR